MKVFKFFIFLLAISMAVVSCSKDETTNPDEIIIPDVFPPVVTLLGDTVVNVLQGTVYTDAGATAYDSIDGDITALIVTIDTVNINEPGTYIVSYNVSDAAGNMAFEVTRTVNVIGSVSGNKYETSYVKIQITGSMTLTMEFNTKAQIIENEYYQVLEFKSNGDFFADDVQYGTWSQIDSIVKVDDGMEIVELTAEGNILKILQSETADGDTIKMEIQFTKI